MRLNHLSLVFLILFTALFGAAVIKRTVVRENEMAKEDVAKACREGVSAAAAVLADHLPAGDDTESLVDAVKDALYTGAAASLGIENIYGYKERIKALVPIICICRESDLLIIKQSVAGGQVIQNVEGPYAYGGGEGGMFTLSDHQAECIEKIESMITERIRGLAVFGPTFGEVSADLPEFALDPSVLAISDPAVLAVAFTRDTLKGVYDIGLYGAKIMPVAGFAGISGNGGKEVHNEKCENLEMLMGAGTVVERRFDTYAAAAAQGYHPAECCDPLSVYFIDSLHLDDLH